MAKLKRKKSIFDEISNSLKQLKAKRTSAVLGQEEESTNLGLDSRNGREIDFDLISQAIIALREQRARESADKKTSNTRRKSLFDKISNMIKKLKHENLDEQRKGKKEKKVFYKEDAIDSDLRRLQKTRNVLFQRLDSIVQDYSEEDEEFHLFCQEIAVYSSQNKMGN